MMLDLCPPDEPALKDTGFTQGPAPEDDIESLKRKKLKLEIKLLEIQNEHYALKLKKNKEYSTIVHMLCAKKTV